MKDNNQGFPPALTHENLAAALKRAADAEDHLRREVASNQALIALAKDRTISAAQVERNRREVTALKEQTIKTGDADGTLAARMTGLSVATGRAQIELSKAKRELTSLNGGLIATIKSTLGALQDKSTIAKLREQLQARDQTIADLQDKIETALLSEWRGGPDADVRVESDHIIIAFPTPNGEWAHAYKHTVSEALTLRRRLETALSTVPGTEMGEGIWEG